MSDPQGNCESIGYDTKGNTNSVVQGQSSSCTGSGPTSQALYQGDPSTTCSGAKTGELCSLVDADSNTTSYSYYSDGDLEKITPPSPLGPTTYTYDGASRVATMRDGNDNDGAPGSIVAVQNATTNITAGGSATVTLPNTVTAGDALVAVVGSDPYASLPKVSTISGGGVTWVKGAAGGDSAVGDDEIWYGLDSTGGSGTTSITVTMTASTNDVGAWVGEFTGVASGSALDVENTTTGTGTAVSTLRCRPPRPVTSSSRRPTPTTQPAVFRPARGSTTTGPGPA